jgi:hypothetical protein
MSTRTNIHFNHGKTLCANIYRHSDGYPGKVVNGEAVEGGVLADLLAFFRLLKAEVPDARFGHAEYLAAKFLVHQAKEYAKYSRIYKPAKGPVDEEGYGPEHPLQFLSVSPCIRDHGDIEYVYEVDCDKFDDEGLPVVRWKAAYKGARFKTVKLGRKGMKAA